MTGTSKHFMLWVPSIVASGRGPAAESPRLTGHQIVVYLDRLNRADNESGFLVAETAGCAARTGLTQATVRKADIRLAEAGLLTVEEPARRGRSARVRVYGGNRNDGYLQVPVALLWPRADRDCPPRWAKAEIGLVVRAVLALLLAADWKTNRVSPQRAEDIARGALLHVSEFRRGLQAIFRGVEVSREGRSTGWLTETFRSTAGGSQTRSAFAFRWLALPPHREMAPESAAPSAVEVADEDCRRVATRLVRQAWPLYETYEWRQSAVIGVVESMLREMPMEQAFVEEALHAVLASGERVTAFRLRAHVTVRTKARAGLSAA